MKIAYRLGMNKKQITFRLMGGLCSCALITSKANPKNAAERIQRVRLERIHLDSRG